MRFNTFETERRRLCILQTLKNDSDYASNDTLLHDVLKQSGYQASHAQLTQDLQHLESLGLVTLKALPAMIVAKLTNDGMDVASGAASAPGVARPNPNELD